MGHVLFPTFVIPFSSILYCTMGVAVGQYSCWWLLLFIEIAREYNKPMFTKTIDEL